MRDGKIVQAGGHSSILQSGTNPLEWVGVHRNAMDAVDTSRSSGGKGASSHIVTTQSSNLETNLGGIWKKMT